MHLAIEAGLCVGANDGGVESDLVLDLLLPLIAKVGKADDRESIDDAALQEFGDDQERLDGLANTHIVCNEEPGDLLA